MDQRQIELIEKFSATEPELKELWEDHQLYTKQVEKLMTKAFLTPTEDQTLKQLKKQKLENKTRMVAMLDRLSA
ncbi:MAG: DUF465 domain-containing protein [Desulfovibrionaceae bacterium]|nr:YdcH family protein [Desulfovibrionaceae bacterium]